LSEHKHVEASRSGSFLEIKSSCQWVLYCLSMSSVRGNVILPKADQIIFLADHIMGPGPTLPCSEYSLQSWKFTSENMSLASRIILSIVISLAKNSSVHQGENEVNS
jgi:hypothetical protein